jgi:hypothetical protein
VNSNVVVARLNLTSGGRGDFSSHSPHPHQEPPKEKRRTKKGFVLDVMFFSKRDRAKIKYFYLNRANNFFPIIHLRFIYVFFFRIYRKKFMNLQFR